MENTTRASYIESGGGPIIDGSVSAARDIIFRTTLDVHNQVFADISETQNGITHLWPAQ
jgi:hypothetical protein